MRLLISFLIWLLLHSLLGCAGDRNDYVWENVFNDSQFDTYQNSFRYEAFNRGVFVSQNNIAITLVDNMGTVILADVSEDKQVIATCNIRYDGLRYVKLLRTAYNRFKTMGCEHCVEAVIYHELAHCVLNKPHDDNPQSLMYYNGIDYSYYYFNRVIVLNNLFYN